MASYRQPGTVLTDHVFSVPLDHGAPDGERIEVFAREVVAADHTAGRGTGDLPWLLFLQGGPGMPSPRPNGRDAWLDRALRDYRVLLLDQRGTGRSSAANRQTLAGLGTPERQAAYLANFRADSIVADAELIRRELAGGRPWSVLGQSYGGFCTVTYLSQAPDGIAEAFITGGLPHLTAPAEDIYRATYRLVAAKNAAHYQRYPGDVERARRIARHLAGNRIELPSGAPLTVQAFQSLGIVLGMSTGSNTLHYLLEAAFDGPDGGSGAGEAELTDNFRYKVETMLTFSGGPLYAALHEACYAQGTATRWAAHRVRAEFAEFSEEAALDGTAPLLFTGEMIYPWMFENDPVLRPLAAAAELLAERADWPDLYDTAWLRTSEVPGAAAIYYDDMYVPAEFSVLTADAIGGLTRWVTNEYEHDGLRVSNGHVLDRLIGMVRATV